MSAAINPGAGTSISGDGTAPSRGIVLKTAPTGPHLAGDFGANLAEELDDDTLKRIAADVIEGIEADIESRTDWTEMATKAVDLLGIEYKAPAAELDGAQISVVQNTLILEMTIRFWALADGEFLPADGPVKVKDDAPAPVAMGPNGPVEPPAAPIAPPPPAPTPGGVAGGAPGAPGAMPPGAAPHAGAAGAPMPPHPTPAAGIGHNGGPPLVPLSRSDLADALEDDCNHYLTKVDKQYYSDFSRMLFSIGPFGTQFRKVYRCMRRNRPVSEWVRADNLIVSQEAAHLSTAERVTERLMRSKQQVRRLQAQGWWRDCDLSGVADEQPNPVEERIAEAQGTDARPKRPQDNRHEIYECYTELDLPGFEHPDDRWLPYRVTIDKHSREVLEIRRNWREDDPECQPRQRYVMFGLLPGLKFYALGFVALASNEQRSLTAIQRLLIDSGMFASFPGALKAKAAGRAGTTDLRVRPGEVKEIDLGAATRIQDAIMEMPWRQPSPMLFQIFQSLGEDTRRTLGALEMPVGEGKVDIPVGTMLAMIEQATKVTAAVHKGLHASRAEELELLRELLLEDPSVLWKFARSPARKWEQVEELKDLSLVPSSDPNIPSHIHRVMLAQASLQMAQMAPGIYNVKQLHEDARRTIGLPTGPEIWAAPQGAPPPPPQLIAAQVQAQSKQQEQQRKAASEALDAQQKQQQSAIEQQSDAADRQVKLQVAQMEAETEREKLRAQMIQHGASMGTEQKKIAEDARQHTVDTMADLAQPAPPPAQGVQAP